MANKRSRIDDVVKLTGVSRATIDRVLNERPGVRADTKERVESALLELGFAPDSMSRRLVIQSQIVRVYLPRGTNPFFEELERGITQSARHLENENVQVYFDGFDPYRPETIAQSLRAVPEGTASVITVGVESPDVEEAINVLIERGISPHSPSNLTFLRL